MKYLSIIVLILCYGCSDNSLQQYQLTRYKEEDDSFRINLARSQEMFELNRKDTAMYYLGKAMAYDEMFKKDKPK